MLGAERKLAVPADHEQDIRQDKAGGRGTGWSLQHLKGKFKFFYFTRSAKERISKEMT